jgi:transposase InsO family protein
METKRVSLEQMEAFLAGTEGVQFKGHIRVEVYTWIEQTLRQIRYRELKRSARGVVRRYIARMTGLSRAQTTRLVGKFLHGEKVLAVPYHRHQFARQYTREDVELLAMIDEAHGMLSGPATQKILQRQCYDFHDQRFARLAEISVAQLCRLRHSAGYRKHHLVYQATRPVQVTIGERRAPQPEGRPGYLRVDTVHQGDRDGVKGVYHINAVDEVTQWEIVSAADQISEAALEPVLEALLAQFPFRILGFHSDNGSEYINYTVAKLLNKLLIEQTKSRPRHSNDNALVECKNGAVIRKHLGYGYIAATHAAGLQGFYVQHFNPYLNFHRPCGVPERVIDARGKEKRRYRWYATPWEILRQLPGVAGYLQPGVTLQELENQARRQSDLQAAAAMQAAKCKLLASFPERRSA